MKITAVHSFSQPRPVTRQVVWVLINDELWVANLDGEPHYRSVLSTVPQLLSMLLASTCSSFTVEKT